MSLRSSIVITALGLCLAWLGGGCSSSASPSADAAPLADGAVASDGRSPDGRDAAAPDLSAADAVGAGPCRTDDDCQLVNDCCSCQAIPHGEKPPACDPNRSCGTPVCAQFPGVDRAHCSVGRCVLGFDCDVTMIACKRLAPVCPPGQVPQVVGQGGARCYGECVDARECLSVPACAACRLTDQCVRPEGSTTLHCLEPSP